MENKKITGALVTVTIAFLVSFGVNVMPEDTHYSEVLGISKPCDRFSKTGLTCYPTPGTRIGSKYSSSGWIPINQDKSGQTIAIECHGWLVKKVIDGNLTSVTNQGVYSGYIDDQNLFQEDVGEVS